MQPSDYLRISIIARLSPGPTTSHAQCVCYGEGSNASRDVVRTLSVGVDISSSQFEKLLYLSLSLRPFFSHFILTFCRLSPEA